MELHDQPNAMLEPEDYSAGYQKNIDALRNNPEVIAFDKMCYEVFDANETGRKFLEFAKERFLIHSQIQRGAPTYETDLVWQEGFRDSYRMIIQAVMSHQQRIKAGAEKQ